jgi:hypothetical protein
LFLSTRLLSSLTTSVPIGSSRHFTAIPHSIHWEGQGTQAVSDHIPIRCSLLTNKEEEVQVARCHGRLKPGPKWLKPPAITSEAWTMQLETAWEDSLASSEGFAFTQQLASAELDVNQEWTMFMRCIDQMFRSTFRAMLSIA